MVFSRLALNPVATIFSGLASKPVATVSPGLASNRWLWFLWFGLKTTRSGFLVWASKLAAMVRLFGPQNHCDGSLVWASKSSRRRFVGLHQYIYGFGLNHLFLCAEIFFIFFIFGGIFGPIFVLAIWRVFLRFLPWERLLGWASTCVLNLEAI